MRVSGPRASHALSALAGRVPEPRRAVLSGLHDPATELLLDQALILWFPGPANATGEDLAELHLHGGRSVVAAVLDVLSRMPGLRIALPGEFTRRAFVNGRIDLAEAEGFADLLAAETEAQRRNALALAGGALSRDAERWREQVLSVSAQIEALLDFSDEGDVDTDGDLERGASKTIWQLAGEIRERLSRPPAELLREGVRAVLAGPPNAGKSTLLNALVEREAAITAAQPGTTRDLIDVPVAIGGTAFILTDTAGLRETEEEIEQIGIDRARAAMATADLILWLGDAAQSPDPQRTIIIHARCDLDEEVRPALGADIRLSAKTGEGMGGLVDMLLDRARGLLPAPTEVALNQRQRAALAECAEALELAAGEKDLVLLGESLRLGRAALDALTGRAGVEDMLDALFGRFCVGK